ncbi:MAG: TIGR03557 family F420-dependent LLM class oxidoreductase [Acidobacteria bacterium]|nr:TIGR03557 family F420-dependent LLM class oxidoreductase [Acidobacteriota bacterium]
MPDKVEIGYKLTSEEFPASALVRFARAAEEHGFTFASISDHYHPWTDRQGQSPFVWSVIGGIAQVTSKLIVGTGVTCPSFRVHPAIIAQAAATAAEMMSGRFFLGVGTGENLNEHILGQGWPEIEIRQQRLAESIQIIRTLWQPGQHSFQGKYFTVENASIYSLPDEAPPIMIAAAGPKSAKLAAEFGDGLIATEPNGELVQEFRGAGDAEKPCYGELAVCFDPDESKAQQLAHEIWPVAGLPGQLFSELPLPSLFESAAKLVSVDQIAKLIPCGPDPVRHLNAIREYTEAGFSHVFIHQIGPNQEAFMDFYAKEILPELAKQRHEHSERAA